MRTVCLSVFSLLLTVPGCGVRPQDTSPNEPPARKETAPGGAEHHPRSWSPHRLPLELDDVVPDDGPVDDWRLLALRGGSRLPLRSFVPPRSAVRSRSARRRQLTPPAALGAPRVLPGWQARRRVVQRSTLAQSRGLYGTSPPTGRQVCRFAVSGTGSLADLRFTPDGATLFAVGHIHQPGEPPAGEISPGSTPRVARRVRPPPSSSGLVTTSASPCRRTARLFFVAHDGMTVSRLDLETGQAMYGTSRLPGFWWISKLGVSPDGKRLAVTFWGREGDSFVVLLDGATGREVGRIGSPPLLAGAFPTFSPDGQEPRRGAATRTASGSQSGISAPSNARQLSERAGGVAVRSRSVRTESGWPRPDPIVVGVAQTGHTESGVVVYDTATWKPAYTIRLNPSDRKDFAFTPDGKALALATGGLAVFDAATGRSPTLCQPTPAPSEASTTACGSRPMGRGSGATATVPIRSRLGMWPTDASEGAGE